MDAQGNIHYIPENEQAPDAMFKVTPGEANALRNVPLAERHMELGLLRHFARLEKNGVNLGGMEKARLKQAFRAGFRCAFGEGME